MERILKGYLGSRAIYGVHYPHRVQNLMVREYSVRNGFQYGMSNIEVSITDSYLILLDMLDKYESYHAIGFFSIYLLPSDYEIRKRIYGLLCKGIELHFVLEQQRLTSVDAIDNIEDILSVKQQLSTTPLYGVYNSDKTENSEWQTFRMFLDLHSSF